MLQDIYYSRRSNKAVQVIAQCRILPDGTEAVCFQEMSGNYDVFVLAKEHFSRIFCKRKREGEEELPEEHVQTAHIPEETVLGIQEKSEPVIQLGQKEEQPEEEPEKENEDVMEPEEEDTSEEEPAVIQPEDKTVPEEESVMEPEEEEIPGIIQFLDADTYEEKMKVLEQMQDELDEHVLNNMAVSLDLTIEDGIDGYSYLMSELRIRSRYEGKRGDRL